MSWKARHIPHATLVDLVEGRLSAAQHTASGEHLATCPRCAATRDWLARTIGLMRDDTLVDAPALAIDGAIDIFRPRIAAAQPGLMRAIVAVLGFDSGLPQLAFGVRSALPSDRQLLWSAPPYEIDLRIAARGDAFVVSGQVLGPCVSGEVELQGVDTICARLNEQCEWSLQPVPPGEYSLVVRLIDAEITIPELRIEPTYGLR